MKRKNAWGAGLLIAAVAVAGSDLLAAEPKKDVSDPVLKEIITSFGSRMPRFVDRHGKDLFVADETVTRGGLMNALYEYDKSLKIPRKDFVTRAEFDELRAKISQMHLVSSAAVASAGGTAKGTGAGKIDIMEVINDLQPNMPVLLDNSLNNSKVFSSLREEVMVRKGTAIPGMKDLQKTALSDLEKRLERIERSVAVNAPRNDANPATIAYGDAVSKQEFNEIRSKSALIEKNMSAYAGSAAPIKAAEQPGAFASDRLRKDLEQTRREISALNRRISELESSSDGGGRYVSEGRSYTAALTKISMGLSMVAALFIAR